MTPDEIIIEFLKTKLGDIRPENGYHSRVITVELKNRMVRDLNLSDCPAILIELGSDRADRETFGAEDSNSYYRATSLVLHITSGTATSDEDISAGFQLKADVMRCLLQNRDNPDTYSRIPYDIAIDIVTASEFDRAQTAAMKFTMGITVKSQLTLGDLGA